MSRKTLALALSGSGSRGPLYLGMLEVFEEQGIPVDAIAATSSASFIACLYASGTLKEFMEEFFKLSTKQLYRLFEPTFKGGVFSLDRIDALMTPYLAAENLEDLRIPISIVTADIVKGETVVLSTGNIMRAIKATCAMPGMFAPVVIGNRVLVDGGLFDIIPADAARAFGMDVVVGVDLSRSLHLMPKLARQMKKAHNFIFRKKISERFEGNSENKFPYVLNEERNISNIEMPNMFSVFWSSLDYSIPERKRGDGIDVDFMIVPEAFEFGQYRVEDSRRAYLEGRKSAEMALPKIRELLKD
jgi:NTE family protein